MDKTKLENYDIMLFLKQINNKETFFHLERVRDLDLFPVPGLPGDPDLEPGVIDEEGAAVGDQLGRALAHKEPTAADAEMLLLLLLLLASALPAVGSGTKYYYL